jgi:hypothetical protein
MLAVTWLHLISAALDHRAFLTSSNQASRVPRQGASRNLGRSCSMRIAVRPLVEFTALFLRGKKENKRLMAMFTVNHEIGIERQHGI